MTVQIDQTVVITCTTQAEYDAWKAYGQDTAGVLSELWVQNKTFVDAEKKITLTGTQNDVGLP